MKRFTCVAVVILLVPALTFAQYGRRRSFWSSPTGRIVAGAGIVGGSIGLGTYLRYRHDQNVQNQYLRAYQSEMNSGYNTYSTREYAVSGALSYADDPEADKIAYQEYRNDNLAVYKAARKDLLKKVEQLTKTQNPVWICAAVCGGWTEFQLHATAMAAGGRNETEASESLKKQCDTGLYFDGIKDNKQGTATISLSQPQNVCYPNKFTSTMHATGNKGEAVKVSLMDYSVIPDNKPVSAKFEMYLLSQIQGQLNLVNASGNSEKAFNELKQEGALNVLDTTHLKLVVNEAQKGHFKYQGVADDEGHPLTLEVQNESKSVSRVTGQWPMTVDHSCGVESHQVQMVISLVYDNVAQRATPSERVVDGTLKSVTYKDDAAADGAEYCGAKKDDPAEKAVTQQARTD